MLWDSPAQIWLRVLNGFLSAAPSSRFILHIHLSCHVGRTVYRMGVGIHRLFSLTCGQHFPAPVTYNLPEHERYASKKSLWWSRIRLMGVLLLGTTACRCRSSLVSSCINLLAAARMPPPRTATGHRLVARRASRRGCANGSFRCGWRPRGRHGHQPGELLARESGLVARDARHHVGRMAGPHDVA